MDVTVKLNWNRGLNFTALASGNRTIQLSSGADAAGTFSPMELFLVSLAGCTAMDILWILERQRQKVDRFELSVRGVRRDEDPRYYETIDLEYKLAGQNITQVAVERAVRLSMEKYCSVRAMIKDSTRINITFRITSGDEEERRFTFAPVPAAQ